MSDDNGSGGAMRVDTDMVKTLAQLLSENDLTEIEVEDGGRRISVKRKISAAAIAPVALPPAPPVAAAAAISAPSPLAPDAVTASPNAVPSPMVGTVYLSAEPGSKPFANVGERVEEGAVLLIIEAMKVMNQIVAPRGGTVTAVLVQNAEPVEYGQPLVVIE